MEIREKNTPALEKYALGQIIFHWSTGKTAADKVEMRSMPVSRSGKTGGGDHGSHAGF